MKINYIQVSNILTFKFYSDVTQATKIEFNPDLSILIGQNGSGKSTALEIINFIFKKVLFSQYNFDQELYFQKSKKTMNERKNILFKTPNINYSDFRLDPNWDTENEEQKIRFEIALDDIDYQNIELLKTNEGKIKALLNSYTSESTIFSSPHKVCYVIDIQLHKLDKTFSFNKIDDLGLSYLVQYNLYKEIISIHNLEQKTSEIPTLREPFSLIGSYRNYHAFTQSVSLGNDNIASKQIQNLRAAEFSKSTNTLEQSEPTIFSLVRLRMAEICQQLIETKLSKEECEERANNVDFVKTINKQLEIVNLQVKIKLTSVSSWVYSFNFIDMKRNRPLMDINSLSAGQKAIIHLVFEAYGQGDSKGGLVIIDEPEIHLHYQFQDEYLRIIENLNKEQKCQYVLVTHSESLINSKTISSIKRLSLDNQNHTVIKSPKIEQDQKTLIKILDNTRTTYAFFGKKILLVEGETDQYLFRAILKLIGPNLCQEISIINIGGKGNHEIWRKFFDAFGLLVYFIGDLDNVFSQKLNEQIILDSKIKNDIENNLKQKKLSKLTSEQIIQFQSCYNELIKDSNFISKPSRILWKPLLDMFINFSSINNSEISSKVHQDHPDIIKKIEDLYQHGIFILKHGSLEKYAQIKNKDLNQIITFCENSLESWLNGESEEAKEIRLIFKQICND